MIARFIDRVAELVTRRRGLVMVILAVGFIGMALTATGIRADFTPQDLFYTMDGHAERAAAFKETFGDTENVLLVLVEAEDVLTVEVLGYVRRLSRRFAELDFVDRLEGLTESAFVRSAGAGELRVGPVFGEGEVDEAGLGELREVLASSELIEGVLLGRSGRLAAIPLFLGEGLTRIEALSAAVAEVTDILAEEEAPPGVTAELTGLPLLRVHVVERFFADQRVFVPLALLVSMLLLWFFFRWLPGVLFPGFAVVISTSFLMGLMTLAGEPINIINQAVPTLIIVIGLSDAIHLVHRYGEEVRRSGPGRRAGYQTARTMAAACFLTSATTAIGFASLSVTGNDILRRFGLTAAVGVMLAYVVTITFVPGALSWTHPRRATFETQRGPLERFLEALTERIVRHPVRVLLLSGVVVVGAVGWAAVGTEVDTKVLETLSPNDPVHQLTQRTEAELSGVLPLEVAFTSEERGRFDDPEVLNAVQRVRDWVAAREGVLSARSYPDYLYEAWVVYTGDATRRGEPFSSRRQVASLASLLEGERSPITPFVTLDRRQLRLNIQIEDIGANATLLLAEDLEARLAAELAGQEGVAYQITGDAFLGSVGLTELVNDMLKSLGLAFIAIFFIMSLLFRSWRMGLLSMFPNAIPLLLTLGYMAAREITLNTTTVVIFSIAIGLAVDDTIHMLARFREEVRHGHDTRTALVRTAGGTGRAIVVTSVMLAVGLSVLVTSSFIPVRQFGELVAITALGCLVADLLVLPALLTLGYKGRPAAVRELKPGAAAE